VLGALLNLAVAGDWTVTPADDAERDARDDARAGNCPAVHEAN
jgi:hypothetical protein